VTLRLRSLLVGLAALAILVVMTGALAIDLGRQIRAVHERTDLETRRLAAAGVPLLLNALIVGDLASAEQTLRNMNVGTIWKRVLLYEPDGRTLILDASPVARLPREAPDWTRRVLPDRKSVV